MIKKKVLIIFGTRPEVIKLAPVVIELRKDPNIEVLLCNTEQQKELSNQTLKFFNLKSDFNLDVMRPNQSLSLAQGIIQDRLSKVFEDNHFDATIVQGDTLTAFCGALVSFYKKVPVFHVEAGLRSYNLNEPYPEEALRQMLSRIASFHFAPSQRAYDYLIRENISRDKIFITGNTVIDALSCISQDSLDSADKYLTNLGISKDQKLILVTAHRRENHGTRLDSIISSIKGLIDKYQGYKFVIPVHPNPNVKEKITKSLKELSNAVLTSPLDYPVLVTIMKRSSLILTDSGGIQEEAPTFNVPILVLRYETERPEGIEKGFAKLVGADRDRIVKEASLVLDGKSNLGKLNLQNPYGNGDAATKIHKCIKEYLNIYMSLPKTNR